MEDCGAAETMTSSGNGCCIVGLWSTTVDDEPGSSASPEPSASNGSDYDGGGWTPASTPPWDNVSTSVQLPEDMRFTQGNVLAIVAYSILMLISALGNLTVLSLLRRKRKVRRSRVHLLLAHLAIADLLVTFLMMPLEVAWAVTVSWKADDASCRIMAFFRAFGLYLSSFILVCMSLDRYHAVIHPLSVRVANRRVRIMLVIAWMAGIFCSAPQMVIFRLKRHPQFPWYYQCVTIGVFPSPMYELMYNLFVMFAMYGCPLVVILVTYAAIIYKITRKSKECNDATHTRNGHGAISLRRSGTETLNRARSKTLRMTIIMVAVFILCWTPYYSLCMWFWFDSQSASKLDIRIQKGLFIFASSNSCMNPLVYGFFMVKCATLGRRNQGSYHDWFDVAASIIHRRSADVAKETSHPQ